MPIVDPRAPADHGLSTPEAQQAYTDVLLAWLRDMLRAPAAPP